MLNDADSSVRERVAIWHLELERERIRSHDRHLQYIYGLRLGGLLLAALTILAGAAMTFAGLQGSFNWAVEAPKTLDAKLTNASPGIVFATVGMFVGLLTVFQKPVSYSMEGTGLDGGEMAMGVDADFRRPAPPARKIPSYTRSILPSRLSRIGPSDRRR